MLVYHSSDQCFDRPDVKHSRDSSESCLRDAKQSALLYYTKSYR